MHLLYFRSTVGILSGIELAEWLIPPSVLVTVEPGATDHCQSRTIAHDATERVLIMSLMVTDYLGRRVQGTAGWRCGRDDRKAGWDDNAPGAAELLMP